MARLQFNTSYVRQLRASFKESMLVIREINIFLRSVDSIIVNWSWVQSVVQGLTSLGAFAAAGYFFQSASKNILEKGKISQSLIAIAIGGFVIYFCLYAIFKRYSEYRSSVFHERADIALNEKCMQKSIQLDIARLTDPSFFELHQSAMYGQHAVMQIFNLQNQLIGSLCGVIASLAVIATIDPYLFVLACIAAVPAILRSFMYQRLQRSQRTVTDLIKRQQNEYYWYLRDPRSLIQAKLFQSVSYMMQRYITCFADILRGDIRLFKSEMKWGLVTDIFQGIIFGSMFVYMGRLYNLGALDIAKILMFFGSARLVTTSLYNFSRDVSLFRSQQLDYKAFATYLDAPCVIDETNAKAMVIETCPTIRLDNIDFAYPSKPNEGILKDCNLLITPFEKIAIVGRNGAGKTTLVKLLAKMYLPSTGEVYINETATSDILQSSLIASLVCCTQDSTLPDLPIIESVTGTLTPDMDRLQTALSLAGCDVFINKLPDGHATRIGGRWNDGKEFSGGELQRLKLAATFYRLFDPAIKIALFDEPMSNCDAQMKNRFYEYLKTLHNKTVIVVAHDHAYLHNFERVIEISDGKVSLDLNQSEDICMYQKRMMQLIEGDAYSYV